MALKNIENLSLKKIQTPWSKTRTIAQTHTHTHISSLKIHFFKCYVSFSKAYVVVCIIIIIFLLKFSACGIVCEGWGVGKEN